MAHGTQKTIEAGVAVVVGLMLAIVGAGILDSSQYDTTFSVDTQSEWDAYTGISSGLVTTGGTLAFNSTATTGQYQSVALDSNESNATYLHISVNYPNASSSQVGLTVNGGAYGNSEYISGSGVLQEGTYRIDVSDAKPVNTFGLQFSRDSDTVESPEVSYVEGQNKTGDLGLLTTVGPAAFGLLLLLVIAQLFDVNGLTSRAKQ